MIKDEFLTTNHQINNSNGFNFFLIEKTIPKNTSRLSRLFSLWKKVNQKILQATIFPS